ncbi:cytochrome P450 [Agrocybe pediades]|nr:cytochrome P450 [Agrocybe pediades]
MSTPVLLAALAFTTVFWKYIRRLLLGSPLDNIAGPPRASFFKGNIVQVFDPNGWDFHKEMMEKYGRVIKIPAMLGDNWLYVFDPKAMHHIIVKEQNVFEETSSFIEGNKLAFGPGLIGTLGEQHRKQRKMLTPVFSIAHMREMIPTFYDVAHKLERTFARKAQNGPQEIDVLHWMTRTALELIGQSGLGWSFDNLEDEHPADEYGESTKLFVPVSFKFIFFRNYFLSTVTKIGTPGFRRWILERLPGRDLRKLTNIIDTMHNTSVKIYQTKKKAIEAGDETLLEQVGRGKDIMSILIKANMNAEEGERLTEEEVLGQMSTLTFAAMDTTSGALSRTLHLLAMHPEAQDKLRQELNEVKVEGQDIGYDQLVSLPYLDAICRETLRLYSPVNMVVRTTRQEAVLPLSQPIRGLDGRELHEIHVPNNTNVIVGIMASNRNPDIWGPDSYEWKPERWLQPLPDSVTNAHIPGVYSNLMTFIGGGRSCIGFKFSQLEMKVVLALLVQSFRFSLSSKEVTWKMIGIASPTIRDSKDELSRQLPLIVERIH